jgi:polar amino acid transport system substrate-binding protein
MRRKHVIACLLALIAACTGLTAAAAESVLISYIEKPPYYYTDAQGAPKGFLIERIRQVMAETRVEIRLESRPPNRALQELKAGSEPQCSLGWFRTTERESFALFTLPLYFDRPLIAVAVPRRAAELRRKGGLTALLALPGVRVGAVAGYSYGDAVDRQLAAVGEQVDRAPSPASNLAKLVAGRFDFALINSEELDHLIAQSPHLAGSIVRLELPDVPPGKARHLMCSRNVDAGLVERMDQAITRLRFDRGR